MIGACFVELKEKGGFGELQMQLSIDETSSYKILRWVEVYTERVCSQIDLHHHSNVSREVTESSRRVDFE